MLNSKHARPYSIALHKLEHTIFQESQKRYEDMKESAKGSVPTRTQRCML